MNGKKRWLPVVPGACILVLVTSAQSGLITNGDFEEPPVSGTWQIFSEIPGWTLESGPSIEIQRGVGGWSAYDGNQWAELDSDENGPGGGHIIGEEGSSSISQTIDTLVGEFYVLTFAFSARPGVDDNHLLVEFGDEMVLNTTASGVGLTDTDWNVYEFTVLAQTETTTLQFSDLSVSNTYGTFIDGVSLQALPGPATLGVLLPCLLTRSRRRHS